MKLKILDLETANSDYTSVCQIGLISIENGEIVSEWGKLVNPDSPFNQTNINIHGITEATVLDAPKLNTVIDELLIKLDSSIVVHHGHFDRIAINKICEKYKINEPKIYWLDSTRIVRRTWKAFSKKGYNLGNVSNKLGIKFTHHDALEDARATFLIVKKAIEVSGIKLEDWLNEVHKPITEFELSIDSQFEVIKSQENKSDSGVNRLQLIKKLLEFNSELEKFGELKNETVTTTVLNIRRMIENLENDHFKKIKNFVLQLRGQINHFLFMLSSEFKVDEEFLDLISKLHSIEEILKKDFGESLNLDLHRKNDLWLKNNLDRNLKGMFSVSRNSGN